MHTPTHKSDNPTRCMRPSFTHRLLCWSPYLEISISHSARTSAAILSEGARADTRVSVRAMSWGRRGITSLHDLSDLPRWKTTTRSGPSRNKGNDLLAEWLIHQFVTVLEDSQCFRVLWAFMSDWEGFWFPFLLLCSVNFISSTIKIQQSRWQECASRGKLMPWFKPCYTRGLPG